MQRKLACVLKCYGRHLKRYEKLRNGSSNENWLVYTDSGLFVLKKMIYFDSHYCEYQKWLTKHLLQANFPFMPVVYTCDGSPFYLEKDVLWQMRPYVRGRIHTLGNLDETDQCIDVLTQLHRIPIQGDLPLSEFQYWLSNPDAKLRRLEAVLSTFLDQDSSIKMIYHYEKTIEQLHLSQYRDWKLPCSIIHGDFHSGNLIFDENLLKCVLDWDTSKIAPYIYDIAKALYLLSRREHGAFNVNERMAKHILRRYSEVISLTFDMLQLIPLLLAVSYIPSVEYFDTFHKDRAKATWYLLWTFEGCQMVQKTLPFVIQDL